MAHPIAKRRIADMNSETLLDTLEDEVRQFHARVDQTGEYLKYRLESIERLRNEIKWRMGVDL